MSWEPAGTRIEVWISRYGCGINGSAQYSWRFAVALDWWPPAVRGHWNRREFQWKRRAIIPASVFDPAVDPTVRRARETP